MIALIEQRRAAIRSTLLTDASADEGVAGCSGRQLENLRREALEEMVQLQGFLDVLRRALTEDAARVYVDAH
jgi:hypothetical protein